MSNAGSPIRSPISQHSSNSSVVRSPLERKETLRAVLSSTKNLQDANKTTMRNLEKIIQQADNLNLEVSIEEKVSCQDEIVMDSQVMTASSRVLKTVSSSLTKDLSPYNYRDFAEKLQIYVHSLPDATYETIDWSMLADEVEKVFKRTPNYSTLLGCLDPLEKKVAVKRQYAKKEALAPMKRPEAVVVVGTEEENSVERTVEKINKLIRRRCEENGGSIDFFRLAVNPHKFCKTVENMLHISFLIRDGIMKMTVANDGDIFIEPTTKEMRSQAKKSDKTGNVQSVVALNVEEWKALIALHQIAEPMIDF